MKRRKMAKPRGPQVHVKITADVIEESIPRDSRHCMIADAIKQCYPKAAKVSVDLATIRFTDPDKGLRYTFLTPRVAQAHLVKFDQGVKPEPFEFRLRGAQVTRAGNKRAIKALTPEQQQQRSEAGKKLNEVLKKTRMTKNTDRSVSQRVGGATPPLQPGKDDVPFSRRRAFGLRGLEY